MAQPDKSEHEHHLVSRGYQQGFADDIKRIAVLSAESGELVQKDRPIKSNWAIKGFLTRVDPETGAAEATLEDEFQNVERKAINQVRTVVQSRRLHDEGRKGIDQLAAVHLVRSAAYQGRYKRFIAQNRESIVADVLEETAKVVKRRSGQAANPAALSAWTHGLFDEALRYTLDDIGSMRRNWPKIQKRLAGHRAHLIFAPNPLPGFVLPDQPVLHANSRSNRYGFKDDLAIGDADTILMPLGRRVLLAYCTDYRSPFELHTKKGVCVINAALSRSAVDQVACHPSDLLDAQRTIRQRSRYPIDMLTNGRIGRHPIRRR